MDEEDIIVLAINETKLYNETSNEVISLDNFEQRRKITTGTGVGLPFTSEMT